MRRKTAFNVKLKKEKSMNQEKRPSLIINVISNWVALAITVIIGLCLTPFIIKYLGKTGYGIWTLVYSVIGYYGILDLGVTSAITRYVARYAGQKDYKSLNNTISTALAIFIFIGLGIIGASFFIAGPLAAFFNIQAEYIDEFRKMIWMLGFSAGIGFSGYLFGAVIQAHERFVISNIITISITLLRTGLIVLFLAQGKGLTGIALSHLISVVVMIAVNYTSCRMLFSHLDPHYKNIKWAIVKILIGFGAATTVTSIADIMRFNLDSFVIGKWVGIDAVAIYGVAALLIRFFMQFISKGIQSVFTPRFAALEGAGERISLQQLFLKSLSLSAFLSFGMGTLIIAFGKQFIILWVGTEFLDAVPVLIILSIAYSIALAQTTGISLLYALKKHYLFAYATIIEGIANVALSIYLAPKYGILGVAFGTAIPMLIIKLIFQPIYISRSIGVSLFHYWFKLLPPLILMIVICIGFKMEAGIFFMGDNYFSLALNAIPFMLVFGILFIGLHVRDKKKALDS
jgi:O-antigen/teichoic acid export membrane protein